MATRRQIQALVRRELRNLQKEKVQQKLGEFERKVQSASTTAQIPATPEDYAATIQKLGDF